MAVSPSDFELYSRVTGRPVPTDRGARMKMAPEVNKFIKSREYERPQKTTLQKGADFLGKAALLGGALAAGHAIGGGFRGNTAENVGKVADVVQNLAKTGVVGAEGGAGKPDTRIVDEWLNSPGNSSFVEYENAAKAATDMAPLSNEVYGALQQEEMLNNLAQDTVLPAQPEGSAQIESPRQKVDSWLATNAAKYRLSGEETGQLLDEAREANKPAQGYYSRQADHIADDLTQQAVDKDDFYERKLPPNDGGGGGGGTPSDPAPTPSRPDGGLSRMDKLMRQEEGRADVYDSVWGKPLDDAYQTAIDLDNAKDERNLARSSALAPVNEGGIRQKAEELGNNIEAHVKNWYHLDNEKIGYQIQGALENENPLAGAAQAAGVIVPALGKQGLLNAGQTAQGLYGYGKEFMGDYIDTVKQGYKKAQDIALSDQIRRSSMGVGGGKVLGGDFSVSGSPLLYGMQNQVDQGWGRHDAAIGTLQKNIQAVLPTTVPTGQVAIGENAQLNRHPDVPPGETDMAPSRLIQQFSDRRISGEGSVTPDDLEIRTDVGVNDPVNFTQLFGKRVGKGEKDKFIAGLKERNRDIYSNASDLPARKEGGKGKMASMGVAGSMAGVADWEDRDAKDPLHGIKQLIAGFSTKPDLSDKAAEEVGRRMAEREQQGNLFEDDNDDPWFS